MDLHDRFRDAERIPVPDLWEDASMRAPGPMPGTGTARRIGVALVAITVAASGVALARGLATDDRPRPLAGPSATPTFDPRDIPRVRFEFLPVVVVSATEEFLVVEAPEGIVRWSVDASCGVAGSWIHNERETGGFGGGCGGGFAYLEAGGVGTLTVGDGIYSVVPGRARPEPGYRVRAILGDGRSLVVTPRFGLWLVVTKPGPGRGGFWPVRPDRDSVVRRVELLDPSGEVVATQDIPDYS